MSTGNGGPAAHPAHVEALNRKLNRVIKRIDGLEERVDDLEHRLETTESLVRAEAARPSSRAATDE